MKLLKHMIMLFAISTAAFGQTVNFKAIDTDTKESVTPNFIRIINSELRIDTTISGQESFDLSQITSIRSEGTLGDNISVSDVYPNPVVNNLAVDINLLKPAPISVTLTDVMGNKLGHASAGSNIQSASCRVNTAGLQSGTYFLSVNTAKDRIVRKFVKLGKVNLGSPSLELISNRFELKKAEDELPDTGGWYFICYNLAYAKDTMLIGMPKNNQEIIFALVPDPDFSINYIEYQINIPNFKTSVFEEHITSGEYTSYEGETEFRMKRKVHNSNKENRIGCDTVSTKNVLKLSSCLWSENYGHMGIDTKIIIYLNSDEKTITDIQFSYFEEINQLHQINKKTHFDFNIVKPIKYVMKDGAYYFRISGSDLEESLTISKYSIVQDDYDGSGIFQKRYTSFKEITKFYPWTYIEMSFEQK